MNSSVLDVKARIADLHAYNDHVELVPQRASTQFNHDFVAGVNSTLHISDDIR